MKTQLPLVSVLLGFVRRFSRAGRVPVLQWPGRNASGKWV